jgi:tRNA threonylcarbamoyladenosine biosynthesis protein TsaB
MIVLGLETSSGLCSVGLADEHGALACRSLTATTVHSEQLPSLIQTVLSEAIISLQDLGAVAVSSGPGSFTGLRIGMSAAKGLCFSLKRPLLVVPTFSGLAVSGATKHKAAGKILVALDAKKGDFYWGIFKMREGAVRAEGSVLLREPGDLKKGIGSQEGLVVVTDSPMVAQSFRGAVMAI